MYTPQDCEEKVISYLQANAALIALQQPKKGGITRGDLRAVDSDRDVVVDTLSLTDGDVQLAVVNVKCYIKAKKEETADFVRDIPDIEMFDLMVREITVALNGNKGKYWAKGNLYISNISNSKLKNADTKEYFNNIRVSMRMHNTKN